MHCKGVESCKRLSWKDYKAIGKAETLNFDGISFPMKLKDIKKFERQNPQIYVNVLGYEDKEIFPLCISDMVEIQYDVNLLLL